MTSLLGGVERSVRLELTKTYSVPLHGISKKAQTQIYKYLEIYAQSRYLFIILVRYQSLQN